DGQPRDRAADEESLSQREWAPGCGTTPRPGDPSHAWKGSMDTMTETAPSVKPIAADEMALPRRLTLIAQTCRNQDDPLWTLLGERVEALAKRAAFLEANTVAEFVSRES